MNLGHILFSFSGRINRAKWWLSVLVSIIISLVFGLVMFFLQTDMASNVLGFVSWIITFWISLAAGAKRLHDLNKSGAWLVLFFGAPVLLILIMVGVAAVSVGSAIVSGGGGTDVSPEMITQLITQLGGIGLVLMVLLLALFIWALVWFGCLRGNVGPNRFGPDPLEGRV